MSGAPGTARRSPYECHPSQLHMSSTRRYDAATAEKGIVEAIHTLASIVAPFAYLLPTY